VSDHAPVVPKVDELRVVLVIDRNIDKVGRNVLVLVVVLGNDVQLDGGSGSGGGDLHCNAVLCLRRGADRVETHAEQVKVACVAFALELDRVVVAAKDGRLAQRDALAKLKVRHVDLDNLGAWRVDSAWRNHEAVL